MNTDKQKTKIEGLRKAIAAQTEKMPSMSEADKATAQAKIDKYQSDIAALTKEIEQAGNSSAEADEHADADSEMLKHCKAKEMWRNTLGEYFTSHNLALLSEPTKEGKAKIVTITA